nr:hypothetical protein [Tanacetum cinerariifolium]
MQPAREQMRKMFMLIGVQTLKVVLSMLPVRGKLILTSMVQLQGHCDFAVDNILDKPDKPTPGQTTSSGEKKGLRLVNQEQDLTLGFQCLRSHPGLRDHNGEVYDSLSNTSLMESPDDDKGTVRKQTCNND